MNYVVIYSSFLRLMSQPSITNIAACCRDASPKTGIDYEISLSSCPFPNHNNNVILLWVHSFQLLCKSSRMRAIDFLYSFTKHEEPPQ